MKILLTLIVIALSVPAFAAWDSTEAVIATKILKQADRNAYRALIGYEEIVKENGKVQDAGLIKGVNPPGLGNKVTTEISVDVIGISIPVGQMYNNLFSLTDENRNSMYNRMENLKDLYYSSDATPEQQEVINDYFKTYFKIDLSQSSQDILNNDDSDLIDLQNQSKLFDQQTSDLKKHITTTTQQAVQQVTAETKSTVEAVAGQLNAKLEKESKEIQGAIDGANAEIQKEIGKTNASLNYLIDRQNERELNEKIAGITNYDKMQQVIDEAKACESGTSTSTDCKFLVGRVNEFEDRKSFLVRKDAFHAVQGTLQFMQGLAAVTGDPELAENVNKAVFVVDTAQKITDLALGLGTQTALASMGDVMSMAGLAMTAFSVLSGGGGESADQMILEELRKIRQQIEDLRKQMHARFDALEKQIKYMGISMNLKFQNTDTNIGVVLDNQQYIISLIENNAVQIAKLAQVQSNAEASTVIRELMESSKRIRTIENGGKLVEEYLTATTSFASFLDYTDVLQLILPQIQDYSLTSPSAVLMTTELSAPHPEKNYANFGLVDYLVRASIQHQLEGDCNAINFNNMYLFNIIGSRLLPALREEFEGETLVYPTSSKYMYYLEHGQLSKSGVMEILDKPLANVDRIVTAADRCLTNYAKVEGKQVNLFSYLINEYRSLVKMESIRILEQTVSGNHMAALNRAVADPQEAYFVDMDKNATFLDSVNPGLRAKIDLSTVDFRKTMIENAPQIDNKFYEKYKDVPACAHVNSHRGWTFATLEEIQANGNFETITLPKILLTKIFGQLETRMADVMSLNAPLSICYFPAELVFEKGNPQMANMKASTAFTLRVGYGKYETYKDQVRFLEVPIYVPTDELKFYRDYSYDVFPEVGSEVEAIGGFQPTLEPLQPIDTVFVTNRVVTASSLMAFVKNKISSYDWECEELPFQSKLQQCWTAGVPPTEAYKKGRLYIYGRKDVVESEELKKISRELRVENLAKNYEIIRNDFVRCYRRMLMGYNQCNFGSYKSFESEEQRVDLTTLNQINALIRSLAPTITSFKPSVTEETRMKYLTNLDLALSPIPQKIMSINSAEGDPLEIIKVEFEALDKELLELGAQTEKVLQIDTKSLLDTKVYEGLKFYSEETHRFFEEAQ